MGASLIVQRPAPDFNALSMNVPNVPIPGISTGREAQYARRVKELEEEIRGVRSENEKHVRCFFAIHPPLLLSLTFELSTESHDCEVS